MIQDRCVANRAERVPTPKVLVAEANVVEVLGTVSAATRHRNVVASGALVSLVKNPVSPQVTKVALVIAYYLVFGCDCMTALLLVSVVPDLLVDADKESSKKALDVLVKKMFRVSYMTRKLTYRPADTGVDTSCAQELCVGSLLKLLVLLQVGCGGMTKDRAS
ncbi:hypothetical protein D1007_39509 [Hordeum vulgare]|nr:hypothetical protein D1007_39509 [Hordeum vulgare]